VRPAVRHQILDAAAALFAEKGFTATSTRMIAERVGIRQASLYYHFSGKDELLAELLTTSVRPSLDAVAMLESLVPQRATPAAALYLLVRVDVATLTDTPHNIGTLYLLPEIHDERYDEFRAIRGELQDAYGRLGWQAATPAVRSELTRIQLGELLIGLTEVVIQIRRSRVPGEADAHAVAASGLRICGLDHTAVAAARRQAATAPDWVSFHAM
jgi:AcrR family transcriptional regulator